jgi:mono/diheme cytochrome c family protein
MFSRLKILLIAIIITVLIYKCSTALYIPTSVESQKSGISLDTLLVGREMYVNNCGSCHTLFVPEQYTKSKWRVHLDSMQIRSGINDQQKEVILKYLELKSKQ